MRRISGARRQAPLSDEGVRPADQPRWIIAMGVLWHGIGV
jgi:hypothetical protein